MVVQKHILRLILVPVILALAACEPAGKEVQGRWISGLMGDYFDCQGNLATMVVERDSIVLYLAGQVAHRFDGLESRISDNGDVEKSSGSTRFVFSNFEDGRMVMKRGPTVQRTLLNNYPVTLLRCP
ncbi:MAG: hypothetical protein EA370_06815 [Wenzhouxiangella sp.]|nr:MAG: hypothetical protein EA370_06815 [Wenzhouxiangella sp.]